MKYRIGFLRGGGSLMIALKGVCYEPNLLLKG